MKNNFRHRTLGFLYLALFLAVLIATFVGLGHCQVEVAIAPDMHPQFLDGTGKPLASGFLYTYAGGSTTLLNTYVDSTGTVQNPDPIPLDATGAASNGSSQTGIWLANSTYKFCAYNAALVLQWCTDNVSGYLGLLNLANTWTFQQTFSQPIIDTANDNQFVLGSGGNQTTIDFPPPSGNATLHFPNTNDTLVGRSTTDTLTNKSLSAPLINGVEIFNGPATYINIPNAPTIGTGSNILASLTGSPSTVVSTSLGATGGVVGICVVGCGITGTATIQQSGTALCNFLSAPGGGDYVQISGAFASYCTDVGPTYPTSGQVIGRVLSPVLFGSTAYQIDLFGPEIQTANALVNNPTRVLCADGSATTVNANSNALQNIKTCSSFASAGLNTVGKSFRVTANITMTLSGVITSVVDIGIGPSGPPYAVNLQLAQQTASAATWQLAINYICTTRSTGAGGVLACTNAATPGPYYAAVTMSAIGQNSGAVNLSGAFVAGVQCSFSVANVSNSCEVDQFVVEALN